MADALIALSGQELHRSRMFIANTVRQPASMPIRSETATAPGREQPPPHTQHMDGAYWMQSVGHSGRRHLTVTNARNGFTKGLTLGNKIALKGVFLLTVIPRK